MKLQNRIFLTFLHILFWAFLAFYPLYFNIQWFGWKLAIIRVAVPFLFFILFGYGNGILLVPHLFNRKKFVWYLPLISYAIVIPIALFLLENIFLFVNHLSGIELNVVISATKNNLPLNVRIEEATFPRSVAFGVLLFDLFVSTLYGIAFEFLKKERKEIVLKAINLKNELKLLRSQINPHFLFNALNNLYAIVQLNPEKSGEFILKLSEMLRYITYDCQHEKVAITKEIAYLKNYIYFQKWRDTEFKNIHLGIDSNVLQMQIEPMLLIPFVENAFKHSYSENRARWISISLKKENNHLHFEIENNCSELDTKEKIEDEYSGIGIDNIKKRLALLYPNQHELSIEQKKESFLVKLIIKP